MCFSPLFQRRAISDYIAHGPIIRVLTGTPFSCPRHLHQIQKVSLVFYDAIPRGGHDLVTGRGGEGRGFPKEVGCVMDTAVFRDTLGSVSSR